MSCALSSLNRKFLDYKSNADEYDSVPVELKALRSWLPFRIECRWSKDHRPQKMKVPYNIAGRKADYTNPSEWMTFRAAVTMLRRGDYDGLGIVIDRRFGIVGYDADSCIANGTISETAREHIATLNTYTEESLSGAGIHCLAYGTLPALGRKSDGFEMYCDRRFFVVTGRHLPSTPSRIEHRQAEIGVVHTALFGREPARKRVTVASESVTQFLPNTRVRGGIEDFGTSVLISDEQVLRLLQHDPKAWAYFSRGPGTMNPSGADYALGCKLAFYTRGDLRQMRRLFMRSALGNRAKCSTTRGSVNYVEYTLQRCLSRQRVFWRPSAKELKVRLPVGRPVSETTKRVLELSRQYPAMRPCEIARTLAVNSAAVRKVLSRHSMRAGDARKPARTQTMEARSGDEPKLTNGLRHQSGFGDAVLQAISKHAGWVKCTTIAAETGMSAEAVRKQLQRLGEVGLVDRDCKGRCREHHERRQRKLKPCSSKPIPKCRENGRERKTLTRTELVRRGWPRTLIEKIFPAVGRDYTERIITLPIGRAVKARYYWVSRIKAIEVKPWFEVERAHARRNTVLKPPVYNDRSLKSSYKT
jgi:putative DNA primase/helicase